MPGPRFSVVLNTFNRAELLPRSMGAVLDQTDVDFELVVVDDGSTDDTRRVVERHDDRRVRYVHRPNGGLAAARNTGLDAATGDYVAFMDDDDRVEPTWLEAFRHVIDETGAAVVTCGTRLVDTDGETAEVRLPAPQGPSLDDQTALFLPGTFVVRRDVLMAVGGYTEGLRCSEQTELSLRVVPHCVDHGLGIAAVPAPNVVTYRRPDEQRPLRRPDYLHSGSLTVLRLHEERLARDPELFANFKAIAGVQAFRLGDYPQARRLLMDAIRADPRRPKHYARLGLACIPAIGRRRWPTWHPPAPAAPIGTG